jgi:putative acetyltransferase
MPDRDLGPALDAVVIATESIESVPARQLIAELDAHLTSIYPPEQAFIELPSEHVSDGRGAFLVARVGGAQGEGVACGAVRLLDPATAEIKRMYVVPAARGHGLSRKMLDALETQARRLGAARIVLETGDRQIAAIGLYESAGYSHIPAFSPYTTSPASVCFAKDLGPLA